MFFTFHFSQGFWWGLQDKLEDMLEKRLEVFQRKAATYANEAVQLLRKEFTLLRVAICW